VQTGEKLLSSLPAVALQPLMFRPGLPDESGDAAAFVEHVREAAQALADLLGSADEPYEPRLLQLLTMFARSVEAEAEYVQGLVEAGAGLRGREPGPVLAALASARSQLARQQQRLSQAGSRPKRGALEALRQAVGTMKGSPADAMDDERALYDG